MTIPSTVTSLEGCYRVFDGIPDLKELTVPITLDTITYKPDRFFIKPMFDNCTKIEKITFTKGTDGQGFNYGEDLREYSPQYYSRNTLTTVEF